MPTSPSQSHSSADAPNPFSIALPPASGAKQRFVHALQFLGIAAAITTVWLLVTVYGKQYLLNQLVQELPTLNATDKSGRLIQIAGFGIDAIEPLSASLIDEEDAVSEVAFGLLNQLQNDWTTLSPEMAARSHQRLIDGVRKNIDNKPSTEWTARQTARTRSLLRQTMLEFAGTETLGDAELTDELRQLIAGVSQSSRDTLARLDQPVQNSGQSTVGDGSFRSIAQRIHRFDVDRLASIASRCNHSLGNIGFTVDPGSRDSHTFAVRWLVGIRRWATGICPRWCHRPIDEGSNLV